MCMRSFLVPLVTNSGKVSLVARHICHAFTVDVLPHVLARAYTHVYLIHAWVTLYSPIVAVA